MSNITFTGGRLMILLSVLVTVEMPAWCQFGWDGNPYDASRSMRSTVPAPFGVLADSAPAVPVHQPRVTVGTVSADMLRNPLSPKARRALEKAMHHSELGDHAAAIQRLHEALARYPQAAPYTLTLLGAELVETRSYGDARNAFELVARAMPHESAAHSNYGLSLALAGNADAAEKELRQAVALDRENGKAKRILEAVLVSKRIPGERAAALPVIGP